jgi:hypothetical protein
MLLTGRFGARAPGTQRLRPMKIRKRIRKEVKTRRRGVDVAGGVNAVVSANVNEPGKSQRVESKQRIVQRSSGGERREKGPDA